MGPGRQATKGGGAAGWLVWAGRQTPLANGALPLLVGVSRSLSRTVSHSFFSLFLVHSCSSTCSFFFFSRSLPAFRLCLGVFVTPGL